MARLVFLLGLLLFAGLATARPAEAQACDRLRVQTMQGNAQIGGLYDFCNEYRMMQSQVQQLRQTVQQQQQALAQVQQMRQMLVASMPVSEIVRGKTEASRTFDLRQPGVLLATGYAAGEVKLTLDGNACGAGDRNVVCQVPLAAGSHTIQVSGNDVVLSVVVLIR